MSLSDYAAIIRIERNRKGWSQRELAREAHITAPTVNRLEQGENVKATALLQAMQALGLPVLDSHSCQHECVCRFCGLASIA